MTKRETAAERRAREAVEAREAEVRWEAEKPMRLLRVLVRAQNLGLYTNLSMMGDDINVAITSQDYTSQHYTAMSVLTEWQMQTIEQDMEDREHEKQRQTRLNEIRQGLMGRLTEEEKEALGLN